MLLADFKVLYNIMGGAFFLEDGIETNNTFQYNLGTFVRPSSSLRNDDVTPSVFWVTNPNNIIIHNAAAGSSHFGYWYRMKEHPEGPSFDASICPIAVPLGRLVHGVQTIEASWLSVKHIIQSKNTVTLPHGAQPYFPHMLNRSKAVKEWWISNKPFKGHPSFMY